ncbi:MAG TPA: serine hydrolase domain-containing protein, partial [Kofleriaceae bacterium]|nr:serine hydrolase domain-containing protein [Kofleriaceae bacterium]
LLPTFAVADSALTRRLTMSDLVCACSGIPYDNLGTELEFAAMTADQAMARMSSLAPVAGYRETYQYSNAMLAAGGFIAAHALFPDQPMGAAYRRTMQTRLFDRLGMTSTTFDAAAAGRAGRASPHDRTTGDRLVSTAIAASDWTAPLEPAWGAWSSVHDLAQVLLLELASGRTPGGGRLLSRANLMARRVPRGRAGDRQRYGLGLVLERYHGVDVLAHEGGVWGYSADFFVLPEHDVGAVVLWNVDYTTPFNGAVLRRKLFELLFDGRDEAREDLAYRVRAQKADFARRMRGVELQPDRAWLTRVAGTYRHPLHGTITVGEQNGRAVVDVGEWQSQLGRKREVDGTWKLVFTSPPWVTFGALVPREASGRRTLQLDAQTGPIVTFEEVH